MFVRHRSEDKEYKMQDTDKIRKDPPCLVTGRVHDTYTQTNDSRMNIVLDERVHKPASQYTPSRLIVTQQMIFDFETSTGFLGIGEKMLKAGFWQLSTQERPPGVRA